MANYRRYLGPLGLLLAVTVAVVLIRVVFASNGPSTPPRRTTTATTTTKAAPRFWTVRAGDTLAEIASRAGVTVASLERLNPQVSPTTLFIGEKLRLR
ncbi:MAG TPA: LysM domain-containing protein [Gaiellaceae bacterium]